MQTTERTAGPEPDHSGRREAPGGLEVLLAGTMVAAGVVHLVMAPVHASTGFADALAFAVVGWVQIAIAALCMLGTARRATWVAAVVVNLGVVGLYVWSRTSGLPFGGHAGEAEPVALLDGLTAGLEVAAVLLAVALLVVPREVRLGRVLPAVAAVALIGTTTAVVVRTDTTEHGGDHHATEATGHDAEMAAVDERRCDLGFNPVGYWSEARRMKVDTYFGGSMTQPLTGEEVARQQELRSTPGTPAFDDLVSATSLANGGEGAAGALVAKLGEADDDTYDRWVDHMAAMNAGGAAGGEHAVGGASAGHHGGASASDSGAAAAAAPDDNGGHGGHIGPQPWEAMTDQAACDTLAAELERSEAAAMALPTAADAQDAGYFRVTGYLPGIAAHYMKFPYVDGRFDVDEPEMLLYDGDGPDAKVVGLSYYIMQPGDSEPTQGFTGPNDHFHRHVGLCIKGGLVIGDSTTTPEDCQRMGGRKNGGQAGWMNHVWIVPGCESPWGLFSGASPVIDSALSAASGPTGAPGCAGSGVRQRYDLSAGTVEAVRPSAEVASGD